MSIKTTNVNEYGIRNDTKELFGEECKLIYNKSISRLKNVIIIEINTMLIDFLWKIIYRSSEFKFLLEIDLELSVKITSFFN